MLAKKLEFNKIYPYFLNHKLRIVVNFTKTISFCFLLIFAFFISSYARVVIKIPVFNYPNHKDFSAYKEFDGRFWFGGGYFEKGSTNYQKVEEIKGQVTKIELFNDKLWILASSLYVVNKGTTKPVEIPEIKRQTQLLIFDAVFNFDDKFWISIDSKLFYISQNTISPTLLLFSSNDENLLTKLYFQEFANKMWLARNHELFYLEKGDNPKLENTGINVGSISGLQVFDHSLFVSSDKGLYYLENSSSFKPIPILQKPVSTIYSYGNYLWVRSKATSESKEQYLFHGIKNAEPIKIEDLEEIKFLYDGVKTEEFNNHLFAMFYKTSTALYDYGEISSLSLSHLYSLQDVQGKFRWNRQQINDREIVSGISKIGENLWVSTNNGFKIYRSWLGIEISDKNINADEKQDKLAEWADEKFRNLNITSQA